MDINWGIGSGGNNALAMFQYGAQLGNQVNERRDQRQQQNALLQQRQQELDARIAEWEDTRADKTAEIDAKHLEAGHKAIAQAAFDLVKTPPEQRSAKWDAYVTRFNMPELVGQYSDQRLNEVVAQAGIAEQFQKFQQPNYEAVGEGGLAGFQFGQPIEQGGQSQNFGPPAAPHITFTPIDGGAPASGVPPFGR